MLRLALQGASCVESCVEYRIDRLRQHRGSESVDAATRSLLITARERNLEMGVTGVLLFSGTEFMQCFEGSPEGVKDVYARIVASSRHHDIRELMNGPVSRRGFKDWQMGFAQAIVSAGSGVW
jgi:hypothetical protein